MSSSNGDAPAVAAADNNNDASVAPAAAAPAPIPRAGRDNTPHLSKPAVRWQVARFAYLQQTYRACRSIDKPLLESLIGSNADKKWSNYARGTGSAARRLEAIKLCLKDIIDGHEYVVRNGLTRNDINVDEGVDPSSIPGWNEAAPPAPAAVGTAVGGGEGGAVPAAGDGSGGSSGNNDAAVGTAGEAETGAAAEPGGGQQLPVRGLRQLTPNSADNAGGGTGSGSKRGRVRASGSTAGGGTTTSPSTASAAASADASARGGGASCTAGSAAGSTATGSPHHKRQRPGSAGGGAGGKENGGADGAIVSAPSAAGLLHESGSVESPMDQLGSNGLRFQPVMSEDDRTKLKALTGVLSKIVQDDNSVLHLIENGVIINGGVIEVFVSNTKENDLYDKYIRGKYREGGAEEHFIPPDEFERLFERLYAEKYPDLVKGLKPGNVALLIDIGDDMKDRYSSKYDLINLKAEDCQPIHADCSREQGELFSIMMLTEGGARGTISYDLSNVKSCSTARELKENVGAWNGAPDSLIRLLDETGKSQKLLLGFGSILSGGDCTDPGVVPLFSLSLHSGAHQHRAPPSGPGIRVVAFNTFSRPNLESYNGKEQVSREKLVFLLYEATNGLDGFGHCEGKFLLDLHIGYVIESAKIGARDATFTFEGDIATKMDDLISAVKEWEAAKEELKKSEEAHDLAKKERENALLDYCETVRNLPTKQEQLRVGLAEKGKKEKEIGRIAVAVADRGRKVSQCKHKVKHWETKVGSAGDAYRNLILETDVADAEEELSEL